MYNSKSKNIIELSKILVEKFNSVVPDNFEDLTSLPGVGRKSANVLLSSLWGKERIAVDTHVFRISNRIGLAKAKNVLQTEFQLYKSNNIFVPKKTFRILRDISHRFLK